MESEDKKDQDARVEKLWKTLDTRKEGRLDAIGLKKGLEKIDHRKSTIHPRWARAHHGNSTQKCGCSPSGSTQGGRQERRWNNTILWYATRV